MYQFERKAFGPMIVAGLVTVIGYSSGTASAAQMTFAQFTEQATGAGVSNIRFDSNAASGYGTSASLSTAAAGGNPVWFSYTGFSANALPTALAGQQDALLTFGTGNAGQATAMHGGRFSMPGLGVTTYQPFDTTFRISFIRATNLVINGHDYGNNLLTVTIAPKADPDTGDLAYAAIMAQGSNSHAASMNFDNAIYEVAFSSSFMSFDSLASLGGSLAFSGIVSSIVSSTGVTQAGFTFVTSTVGGARSFVQNFLADVTGTFAADPAPIPMTVAPPAPPAPPPPTPPVPTIVLVPEPMGLALLGMALAGLGLVRRRAG